MIKFLSDVTSGLRYNSKTLCLSLGAATASDTKNGIWAFVGRYYSLYLEKIAIFISRLHIGKITVCEMIDL